MRALSTAALALLLGLCSVTRASADDEVLLNKFVAAAPIECNGQDQAALTPLWEPEGITIREVHLSVRPQPMAGTWYAYVGPEPMGPVLIAPHTMMSWRPPAGTVIRFRAANESNPASNGIELHLSCHGGVSNMEAFAVILYTKTK